MHETSPMKQGLNIPVFKMKIDLDEISMDYDENLDSQMSNEVIES